MDTDLEYQKIISEIKQGHRALTRFKENDLEELLQKLKINLDDKNLIELEKLLCLLEHSAALCLSAGPLLLEILNTDLPDPLLIFALNASRRHIILAHFQRGHRLNFDFLETLKKLLYSSSPEVVEWTLRTIEECGNQGVYFLREFDKIKPAPWKWFNAHQRAVREIITMLERRWSRFEKSRPGS
jgi:hypothetical protein